MPTHNMSVSKLADLATIFGAKWKIMWDHVKEETGTRQRKPRSVSLYSDPRQVYVNDNGEMSRRFAWNMETGEVSPSLNVSGGEWACHAGSNNDEAVTGLPRNVVIVTVTWHDYHRYLYLEVQAHPDMLSKALEAA